MERLAFAVCLFGLSFILLATVGFGAKTSCTSTGNHAACDAIDGCALGGFVAVAAVGVVGTITACDRRGMGMTAACAGCVFLLTCVGMFALQP